MRTPHKATALVLAGAVGLASAAYGIGTQEGDGTATADSQNGTAARGFDHGPPPGFSDLADKLGVDADKLAQALRDFHEQERGDMRTAFAQSLADALGVSVDKVNQAFAQIEDAHKSRFAARLADALGLDTADVKAALDKLAQDKPDGPGAFEEALADELGVSADKVREALWSLRPEPRARRHDRHHAAPLRQLASALDVTRAELRKGLREVRAGADSAWEQREAELAAFLADRFNISADKVGDALADLPRPDRGPGPRGHGGPDGPGGPGGPPGPGGPGFGPGFAPRP
jgi:transcriptional regulator with XRE-family HTH domain